MSKSSPLVEVWRGDLLECLHRGHAVVVDEAGETIAEWGNGQAVIYPRSSCKMIQALPLLESGAGAHLTSEQLALSCASHNGAEIHTHRVMAWLADLGLTDDDLRCGPQEPADRPARNGLITSDTAPCQVHNNCSGKHAGFLTLNQHLSGHVDYIEVDHPVQIAIRDAFEEMTGEASAGYGIDGCSAPNFSCTVTGLARAAARMAHPAGLGRRRADAAEKLVAAMQAHPLLVAGEGRACSEIMAALPGRGAVKTGAEGVFVAILPEQRLGVAVKIEDGATRAAECAIATVLVRLGVVSADDPAIMRRLMPRQFNRRGIDTGFIRPDTAFYDSGHSLR